jgi:hypothetical protein
MDPDTPREITRSLFEPRSVRDARLRAQEREAREARDRREEREEREAREAREEREAREAREDGYIEDGDDQGAL